MTCSSGGLYTLSVDMQFILSVQCDGAPVLTLALGYPCWHSYCYAGPLRALC
jgi:hypothetical protein